MFVSAHVCTFVSAHACKFILGTHALSYEVHICTFVSAHVCTFVPAHVCTFVPAHVCTFALGSCQHRYAYARPYQCLHGRISVRMHARTSSVHARARASPHRDRLIDRGHHHREPLAHRRRRRLPAPPRPNDWVTATRQRERQGREWGRVGRPAGKTVFITCPVEERIYTILSDGRQHRLARRVGARWDGSQPT